MPSQTILTVGHSNVPLDEFIALLDGHAVDVVVDVRSSPASRYAPHFSGEQLRRALSLTTHRYLFMGDVLGGRPDDPTMYDDAGFVLYDRVAASVPFQVALDRLQAGMARYRIALLCAEEDPTSCHRRRLVARALGARGVGTAHIRHDGRTEDEHDIALREALDHPERFQLTILDDPAWRSVHPVPPDRRPRTLTA
jgi:uncharacterized protein (DUF488 family)